MILLDSNVILDVWNADPIWSGWSTAQMRNQAILHELAINPIVYSEISVAFPTPALLDRKLADLQIVVLGIPREAAFLAGKAYVHYRRKGGSRSNVLPDFFIGAHATVLGCAVLTRDTRRYTAYFPKLRLVKP